MKRYVPEPGSDRVRILFRRRRAIAASRITYAEVVAAVARAWRERLLGDTDPQTVFASIEADFGAMDVIEARRTVIDRVPSLVVRHPLRGYDAVQLASALTLRDRGVSLDFWCADKGLDAAARVEGLRATFLGTT